MPRLHLHVESADHGPQGLGIVEEWLARGVGGSGGRRQGYETATVVNWDSTPARESPVWLAGLGVLPPLPWEGAAGGGNNSRCSDASLILPYVTSLGDVYLQRVLCDVPADATSTGLRRVPPELLPCGVSPHVASTTTTSTPSTHDDAEGPLPSSALLQAWDAESLREHRAVPVDPPARAFGGVVATGKVAAQAPGRVRLKKEGLEQEPDLVEPELEESSSGASMAATVAEAVARVQGELRAFMERHPRTLLEVAAELERLSPGAVTTQGAGGEEGLLRALHGVLAREKKRAGLGQAQAGDALGLYAAARPEEPRRSTSAVPVAAAAAAGGEEEMEDGAARRQREGCCCSCTTTIDGPGSPCSAPSCLRPARALYWVKKSEALVPRIATVDVAADGGSGGGGVGAEGLSEDVLQALRGGW